MITEQTNKDGRKAITRRFRMTLTLKQMQDMGMSAFFSDKEVEKQIQQALDKQKLALDFLSLKTKQSKIEQHSLDYILTNGGKTKHTFEGVKYSISVLTYQDLNLIDNSSIYKDDGIEYELPTKYKFSCRIANGNMLTVKAKDYTTAQNVVNDIVGGALYRVSCS